MAATILHGAPPGEVPIEFVTRYDFVLNGRTAAALGMEIPPAILLQANEVFSS